MNIGILLPPVALADDGSGSEPPGPPIGTVSGGDGNEPPSPDVTAEQPASSQTDSYLKNEGLSLSGGLYVVAGILLVIGLYLFTRRSGRKE